MPQLPAGVAQQAEGAVDFLILDTRLRQGLSIFTSIESIRILDLSWDNWVIPLRNISKSGGLPKLKSILMALESRVIVIYHEAHFNLGGTFWWIHCVKCWFSRLFALYRIRFIERANKLLCMGNFFLTIAYIIEWSLQHAISSLKSLNNQKVPLVSEFIDE